MKIDLKSKAEIEKMRLGGKIASRILKELQKEVKPGIKTKKLAQIAHNLIIESGAKASFKGFHNYPAEICISVNEEIVHGLPSEKIIRQGDIISLDLGIFYQGFHTDTAITFPVGKISPEARRILATTKKALHRAIRESLEGKYLGDVQHVIQKTIENDGFKVVRGLTGHGVGRCLQEYPSIPNYGHPGTGIRLKPGMTLAIEPMVAVGDAKIAVLEDGWTIITADKSLSAHFEHTIAITEGLPIILTQ